MVSDASDEDSQRHSRSQESLKLELEEKDKVPLLNSNNSPSKSNKVPYSSFCSKDLLAASSFGLISDRDGAEENASFGPSPSKPIINGRRRMNPTEPSELQIESLSMIGNEHLKPAIVTNPT